MVEEHPVCIKFTKQAIHNTIFITNFYYFAINQFEGYKKNIRFSLTRKMDIKRQKGTFALSKIMPKENQLWRYMIFAENSIS